MDDDLTCTRCGGREFCTLPPRKGGKCGGESQRMKCTGCGKVGEWMPTKAQIVATCAEIQAEWRGDGILQPRRDTNQRPPAALEK